MSEVVDDNYGQAHAVCTSVIEEGGSSSGGAHIWQQLRRSRCAAALVHGTACTVGVYGSPLSMHALVASYYTYRPPYG